MAVATKKKKTESARGKSLSKGISNIPVYDNAHAHLLDELRWLNRLLSAHVLRLRHVNFYQELKDFHGFFIADAEVDALVSTGIFEENERPVSESGEQIINLQNQAQTIRAEINARVQRTVTEGKFLPLVHIANSFQLTDFEFQALVICLAPQIDARYEKLYSYLQNDMTRKAPSIELIVSLLCNDVEQRLSLLPLLAATANLRHFGLIEYMENESGTSAAQHFLRADERIVQFALGNNAIDKRLSSNMHFLEPVAWQQVVIEKQLRLRLQKLGDSVFKLYSDQKPILYFYGPSGVGKKSVARALCQDADMPLVVANMQSLLENPENFRQRIRHILREGLLQPCAVYLDHFEKVIDKLDEMPGLLSSLIDELRTFNLVVFVGSAGPPPSELYQSLEILPVEVPRPDGTSQMLIWKHHLDSILPKKEWRKLDQLTSRFNLTGGQIAGAVHLAKSKSKVKHPDKSQISIADLFLSSRIQSQPKLSSLANKIEPKQTWDDIVLPDDQMTQLRELTNCVKYRRTVMDDWGFAKKLSLGRGVNALFSGPSGTGKTMAAEVIANDLALDLFKIDLSAVVSKYIGETEKNLSRIFTEAEHSNAILFFDEADALFGKRSEVKDAHDRYANIEVGYLLQRMEEYEGVVILATNLSKNMDDAFVRRIHFIVEFPFPTELYRSRIWQGIWPDTTPRSKDLDPNFMAQRFDLSGGNIRNIALAASYLAVENGGVVNLDHLIHATRREYQKMGKMVSKETFRKKGNKL